jgi:hypothetical protein
MRRAALLILVLAACSPGSEEGVAPHPPAARAPETVAHLTLAEDTDEIPPVNFPHGRHNDPAAIGRELPCSFCHHTLADLPKSLPTACGTCHPHESEPGEPPDI